MSITESSEISSLDGEDGTDYVVDYMYDETGRPISFAISKNGGAYEYYFYETNMFGMYSGYTTET